MSEEDLDRFEADAELALYKEYRDVVGLFSYVVETDRRFYLANEVDVQVAGEPGDTWFDVHLTDAWVWDVYRPARFVSRVRVMTYKDVNVEELPPAELVRLTAATTAASTHLRHPVRKPPAGRAGTVSRTAPGRVSRWGAAYRIP